MDLEMQVIQSRSAQPQNELSPIIQLYSDPKIHSLSPYPISGTRNV